MLPFFNVVSTGIETITDPGTFFDLLTHNKVGLIVTWSNLVVTWKYRLRQYKLPPQPTEEP
jgi:hypothetical protein